LSWGFLFYSPFCGDVEGYLISLNLAQHDCLEVAVLQSLKVKMQISKCVLMMWKKTTTINEIRSKFWTDEVPKYD